MYVHGAIVADDKKEEDRTGSEDYGNWSSPHCSYVLTRLGHEQDRAGSEE